MPKTKVDVAKQNFATDEEAAKAETLKEGVVHKNEEVTETKIEDKQLREEVEEGVDQEESVDDQKDRLQKEHNDAMLAALGYIPPLFLLPLLAKKDSEFCQFHGMQAMCIFIFLVMFQMITWLFLSNIQVSRGVWWMIFLIKLTFIIISCIGLFAAVGGKKTKIPPFSIMADSLKWQ
ncbi:MAG TPA: hypothetical protein VIT68_03220 [Candidatus Gracilibacteria bacterium]